MQLMTFMYDKSPSKEEKSLYVEALKWYSNTIKQESTKGIGKYGKILSAGN